MHTLQMLLSRAARDNPGKLGTIWIASGNPRTLKAACCSLAGDLSAEAALAALQTHLQEHLLHAQCMRMSGHTRGGATRSRDFYAWLRR